MPVTNYIWDEVNDTLLEETDENGSTVAEYTHEPAQHGGLISQHRNGQTSYYHYDGFGSTRALTDESGNVTDTYAYDAWGNEVDQSGTTANPFRWVGQVGYYYDETLGTFSIRARAYEPTTGRWTSQDPHFYPVGRGLRPERRETVHYTGTASFLAADGGNPNGEIRVSTTTPTAQFACNRKNDLQFRFDLEYPEANGSVGAPCAGFIIQKVTVECDRNLCPCGRCRIPGDPEGPPKNLTKFSYWEAWFIKKGEAHAIDTAYIPSWRDSCGYYKQTGEIKFYCMTKTSDPRAAGKKVGTGDLRTKWKVDPKPFGQTGGNPLCKTSAGYLPATSKPEDVPFWGNDPLNGPASRTYILDFDCCKDSGKDSGTVLVQTDPEFKP